MLYEFQIKKTEQVYYGFVLLPAFGKLHAPMSRAENPLKYFTCFRNVFSITFDVLVSVDCDEKILVDDHLNNYVDGIFDIFIAKSSRI